MFIMITVIITIYLMCMDSIFSYMYVYHLLAWYLQNPVEGVKCPVIRVTDGC